MIFNDTDRNANILRIVVDSVMKNNLALVSNLKRSYSEIMDQKNCVGEARRNLTLKEGIEHLSHNRKLNNIDIAYFILLTIRGFQFRTAQNQLYFCEEDALSPFFEKLKPYKPQLSKSYRIKSAILIQLLKGIKKDDNYIKRTLIRTVPEFLERTPGVSYTGRFLSINEWINLKEEEPDSKWKENEEGGFLVIKDLSLVPWIFANLIILEARGYFLQEIPAVGGSSYTLLKKKYFR